MYAAKAAAAAAVAQGGPRPPSQGGQSQPTGNGSTSGAGNQPSTPGILATVIIV